LWQRIADQQETFADEQVERYWQLVGTLNGRPPFTPHSPRWPITALRAKAGRGYWLVRCCAAMKSRYQ
jgi:hypothetical protein